MAAKREERARLASQIRLYSLGDLSGVGATAFAQHLV